MESKKEECSICDKQFDKSLRYDISCASCDFNAHYKCAKLNMVIYKFLTESKNACWFCDQCSNNKKFLINLMDKLSIIEKKLSDHDKKLSEINQPNTTPLQYSQLPYLQQSSSSFVTPSSSSARKRPLSVIAASDFMSLDEALRSEKNKRAKRTNFTSSTLTPQQSRKSDHVIVIKPVTLDDAMETSDLDTASKVKSVINPIQDPVKALFKRKNGKVIIHCKDGKAADTVKLKLIKELGNEFEVNEPKDSTPVIKVVGFRDYIDESTTLDMIRSQNCVITQKSTLSIVEVRKRNDYVTLIIKIDSNTFEKIMNAEDPRLSINWDYCKVYEHINVTRCFQCQQFNHFKADCKNKAVCAKCTGEHEAKDCTSRTACCINCVNTNSRLNLSLNTSHYAWAFDCQVMKRRLEQIKQRIKYAK